MGTKTPIKKKIIVIKKVQNADSPILPAFNKKTEDISQKMELSSIIGSTNSSSTGCLIYNAQEIYPGLWLGDINSALDKKFLHNKKITCIFNCTRSLPFIEDPYITSKYRVAVMDNLENEEIQKMYKLLNPTINKLYTMLNANNVLVHCHKGKQRSATIIIAYLMKFANMTKDEALYTIRTKRPIICTPSTNFDISLDKFEHDLRK
jgi:dual specificity phosphatase 12